MKNIQIIDAAQNCVFDIFATSEEQFQLIFPNDTDIAFIDEVESRLSDAEMERAFTGLWDRRLRKSSAQGIHGTLFYQQEQKKKFYPTRKDEEAQNPDGSPLRAK